MMNRTGRGLRFSPWPIMLVLIATGMAVAVFVVTQNVQQQELRVAELNHKLLSEQQTLRVLDAEWAYLTRPQRLESLIVMKAEKEAMPPIPAPIATLAPMDAVVVEAAAGVAVAEKPVEAPKKKVTAVSLKKEIPVAAKKAVPVKVAAKAKVKAQPNIKDDVWKITRKTPAPTRSTQQFASVKRAGVARPIVE